MRKFLFSGIIWSTLFSGLATAKLTSKGPRDWRLALKWIAWGLSLAIAVGTVVKANQENEEPEM